MARGGQSQTGSGTFLLLLIGLVTALILFLRKASTSKTALQKLIQQKLEAAGYSMQFANMWVAVARHETGDYTSPLFRNANNLFGMGYPTVGKDYGSVQSSEGLKSKYPSVSDSVNDLVEYLEYFHYPKSFADLKDLVTFMKSKGYYGSTIDAYYAGVRRFYPYGSSGSW